VLPFVCAAAVLIWGSAAPAAAAQRAPLSPASVRPLDVTNIPPIEPGRRVVSVVAADIDGDGDLDVVANDGSLDLLVWVNDGTGHLTRKSAGHSRSWRTAPPAPHLGDRAATAIVVTVTDPPVSAAPDGRLTIRLPSSRVPLLRAFGTPQRPDASSKASRAPPTSHLS
jgi:hypothetical protein